MIETTREQRDEERRRSRTQGAIEGGGNAEAGAVGFPEDQLFEDPFDRPKESAR